MIERMKTIYIFFDQHHIIVQNSFHSPSIPFNPSEHIRVKAIPIIKHISYIVLESIIFNKILQLSKKKKKNLNS